MRGLQGAETVRRGAALAGWLPFGISARGSGSEAPFVVGQVVVERTSGGACDRRACSRGCETREAEVDGCAGQSHDDRKLRSAPKPDGLVLQLDEVGILQHRIAALDRGTLGVFLLPFAASSRGVLPGDRGTGCFPDQACQAAGLVATVVPGARGEAEVPVAQRLGKVWVVAADPERRHELHLARPEVLADPPGVTLALCHVRLPPAEPCLAIGPARDRLWHRCAEPLREGRGVEPPVDDDEAPEGTLVAAFVCVEVEDGLDPECAQLAVQFLGLDASIDRQLADREAGLLEARDHFRDLRAVVGRGGVDPQRVDELLGALGAHHGGNGVAEELLLGSVGSLDAPSACIRVRRPFAGVQAGPGDGRQFASR